jgi:hypothetical protein
MTRVVLLIINCTMLIGCVSHGQLSTLTKYDNSTDFADVYVIRKKSIVGAGGSYTIALDFQDIVAIGSGDYIHIKVPPGQHTVTAKFPPAMFIGPDREESIELDTKSTSAYYIYVFPLLHRAKVEVSILSEEEGVKLVRDSNLIDLK